MLFLSKIKSKKITNILLLSVFIIIFSELSAIACTDENKRHILSETEPVQVFNANFVGKITIEEISKKGIAVATILASQTHPQQIGNQINIVSRLRSLYLFNYLSKCVIVLKLKQK